ncbi:hypothetical protein Bpfe_030361 [Biomphalaria pfeifferi]|uniref:Uncharacterized protein n=1 Tax=Biomphalaria pfeifferi TaxID=112525 RepID=A0AAD8ARE9_BIOPF|nr:hypothetical protein Bpfe_030361 [Biomphalaria pfeifferi]
MLRPLQGQVTPNNTVLVAHDNSIFVAHSASLSEKLLVSRKKVRLLRKRYSTRRVNQDLRRKSMLITSYCQVKAAVKRDNERLYKENHQLIVKVIFGGSSVKQIGYTQTMFIFKQCMMLTSFGYWLTFNLQTHR